MVLIKYLLTKIKPKTILISGSLYLVGKSKKSLFIIYYLIHSIRDDLGKLPTLVSI